MSILISVLCSVLIGTAVAIALLALTRNRLAKQFADIERRLFQAERTILAIKSGRESGIVSAQLGRLHKGLTRLQENVAHRYGPLAEELRKDAPEARRFLGDYAIAKLEQWSSLVGARVSPSQIEKLAAEVARLDASAEAPDFTALLAALIAMQRWRNGGLAVALGDLESAWLRGVVGQSTSLGAMDVRSEGADVVLLDGVKACEASLGCLKAAGGVVVFGAVPAEESEGARGIPHCELLAAGNGISVYLRKPQN